MNLKLKRRFILSRDLKILRALVDVIIVREDDIYISVAYRKGRAFCRYDNNFKMKSRVEEQDLEKLGFGDFRGMTVDHNGNMIAVGQIRPDTVTVFTLSGEGKIVKTSVIHDFPLLESICCDNAGNLYLHSPVKDYPVYKYSPDLKLEGGFGEFPKKTDSVVDRMARISLGNNNCVNVLFENSPASLIRYASDGKEVFRVDLPSGGKTIDDIAVGLDMCETAGKGDIYLLREHGRRDSRLLEKYDSSGRKTDETKVPEYIRRFCADGNGAIHTSGTLFGLKGMMMSGDIYGATTFIDELIMQ
ncbi:MAG: hypothetical protein LWY06_02420 [Firmicutes bacterium]|nr:hypothetical protein [Bacillota bacterium]